MSAIKGGWHYVFGLWSLVFALCTGQRLNIPIKRSKTKSPRPKTSSHKKSGHCWPPSNRFRRRRRPLDDDNSFIFVKLLQQHFDNLTLLCGHQFADVVGLNRQLTV